MSPNTSPGKGSGITDRISHYQARTCGGKRLGCHSRTGLEVLSGRPKIFAEDKAVPASYKFFFFTQRSQRSRENHYNNDPELNKMTIV